MTWDLIGDVAVGFDAEPLDQPLIGDALIKVEHSFDYATFPGLGYALLTTRYYNEVEGETLRLYPVKNSARIYSMELSAIQKESGWLLRDLFIRKTVRTRVQADANWRIKVYEWLGAARPQ